MVSDVKTRLMDGVNKHVGRVELSINGEFGTICGSGWDDNDAMVLCRMLNYSSGRALKPGSHGPGSGPIWIGYMRCKGNENSIFQCPMYFNNRGETVSVSKFLRRPLITMTKYGCHNHQSDASVQCYDKGTWENCSLNGQYSLGGWDRCKKR